MRAVHDIWYDAVPGHAPGPCAFVQHGRFEDGFQYEVVCPFCEQTVGDFIQSTPTFTNGWLLKQLKARMASHMPTCTASGWRVNVYVTHVPLNTEEEPRIM